MYVCLKRSVYCITSLRDKRDCYKHILLHQDKSWVLYSSENLSLPIFFLML